MTESNMHGIYKKPANDHLVELYQNARQELVKNNVRNAKTIIQTAIHYGLSHSLDSDVNILQCILHEIELYEQAKQSEETADDSNASQVTQLDFLQILNRPVKVWSEKWIKLPQSVFYLRIQLDDGRQPPLLFVGRKYLSSLFVANRIPELHCSQIRSAMLLGLLHHTHTSESTLRVHYYPLTFSEKRFLFNFVAENHCRPTIELIYPFCLLHPSTHRELQSEADGWLLTTEMVNELGEGESHLRDYSVKILAKQQQQHSVLYDPACSTGQFLATLKHHFPDAHTIGQDLSESMVRFARDQGNVDEAVHADAVLWPLGDRQVDAAFIRFLNSEVVTTEAALVLFDKIAARVKSNGTIIVFGHTPVLLASTDFLSRDSLVVEQSVGVASDESGIFLFQYYVLKVK